MPDTSIRPFSPDDIPSLHRVVMRSAEQDRVDPISTLESIPTLEQLVESLDSNNADPNSDVFVAVDDKTKDIVGYGKIGWWQEEDGTFVYIHQGNIDPEHRGNGVGQELLNTLQTRIRDVASSHPEDKPKVFGANASESEEASIKLLEKDGYKKVWSQVEMEFTDFDSLIAVEEPEGFDFRPPETLEEKRKVYELNVRVYEGTPGSLPASEDGFKEYLEDHADLSLWNVAWDGDNVAGFVLSRSYDDKGEVSEVATAPEYRRRGLGKWLMAENIKALHERGNDIVRLHTNSDGAQGGRQLYESMGFSALKESHRFRKPLLESKINPEEVEVGAVQPDEMQELADLAAKSFSDAFGDEMEPEDLAKTLEDNRSLAYFERTKDSSTIIVARYKEKIAGYAQYGTVKLSGIEASPEDREIGRVYVDTDLHGSGIGRRLMDATLADPDVAKAPNVYLQVWEENEPAIALYEKYGFENSGAVEEFLLAGKPARDIIMVRHQSKSRDK
jgi:mycothiol synthase